MKKTFVMMAAMMVSVLMQAASYGILVNGNKLWNFGERQDLFCWRTNR